MPVSFIQELFHFRELLCGCAPATCREANLFTVASYVLEPLEFLQGTKNFVFHDISDLYLSSLTGMAQFSAMVGSRNGEIEQGRARACALSPYWASIKSLL